MMSGVPKIPLIIYENRNKNGQNYQKKMGKMTGRFYCTIKE